MSTMNVDQVLAQMRQLTAVAQGETTAHAAGATGPAGEADFSTLLKASIDKVNATQKQAASLAESFSAGDPATDLSEVMIALQKASVSFQAMTEVRNKLVDAYRDIMSMQL